MALVVLDPQVGSFLTWGFPKIYIQVIGSFEWKKNACVCGDPNFETQPFQEALEPQVTLVAQNFQITWLRFSDRWLVAQGSSFCQGSRQDPGS
jgi:hypothetical protein